MSTIQFLAEWGVRSSILILAGALLLWLLRVKNPSIRLTAWTAVLAGSLAIPLLTAALPKLPVAVLPPSARWAAVPAAVSREAEIKVARPAIPVLISPPAPARAIAARHFDWPRLAAVFYGLVSGALLLRLFAGFVVSQRILRRSRATGIVAGGAEVRESSDVASPVTAGILRPAMLLPPDWRGWDSAKLDAVVAHECSHIRRRDPAVQLVSGFHRALLWVSPASWFLHSRIVRIAEEISDDDAVAATCDRVSYAAILLEFVQRGAGDANWVGVPMARYDRPEKRIRRILNSTAVPRGVTRWGVAAILVWGAPVAYLAAAAHPQSAPQPASAPAPIALAPAPVEAPAPTPAPRPAPALAAAPQPAAAQDTPSTGALPEFEVAIVKPVDPNVSRMMGVQVYPGGRLVISAFSLKGMIATAFGVSYTRISGGDEWAGKDEYNVEAQPSDAMRSSIKDLRYTLFGIEDEHLREMLQALLIDRFQLKFHRETKTGDVYLLERNGKTLKLHPTEIPAAEDPSPDRKSFGSIGYVDAKWGIFATSMPQLAKFASDFILHAPVLDRTELSGQFDYRQRQPDIEPTYSGDQSGSFRGYLQELGLKLERANGPVETFVIDRAAKPSPN